MMWFILGVLIVKWSLIAFAIVLYRRSQRL